MKSDKNTINLKKESLSQSMLYAYRYLLNREPENLEYVFNNQKDWKQLKKEFTLSKEYEEAIKTERTYKQLLYERDRLEEQLKIIHKSKWWKVISYLYEIRSEIIHKPIPRPYKKEEFNVIRKANILLEDYEQQFLDKLISTLTIKNVKKILDIGCGSGRLTQALAQHFPDAEVIGIDPFLEEWWSMGEMSRDNWKVQNGDGEKIEFADETFDLIVSVAALEHISNPENCLAEVKRVLRTGGEFHTVFAPIWSGIIGHHWEHWIADSIKLPPWGHLYMNYEQMFNYILQTQDEEKSKEICDAIYVSTILNRVDTKRFEKAFKECGMTIIELSRSMLNNRMGWIIPGGESELSEDIIDLLDNKYTAEELLVSGYELVLKKA